VSSAIIESSVLILEATSTLMALHMLSILVDTFTKIGTQGMSAQLSTKATSISLTQWLDSCQGEVLVSLECYSDKNHYPAIILFSWFSQLLTVKRIWRK